MRTHLFLKTFDLWGFFWIDQVFSRWGQEQVLLAKQIPEQQLRLFVQGKELEMQLQETPSHMPLQHSTSLVQGNSKSEQQRLPSGQHKPKDKEDITGLATHDYWEQQVSG